eukprot:3750235-Ditylum_brightwellii.AAC.1
MKGTMGDSIENIKQEVGHIQNTVNATIVGIKRDMGTLKTDVKAEIGSLYGEVISINTYMQSIINLLMSKTMDSTQESFFDMQEKTEKSQKILWSQQGVSAITPEGPLQKNALSSEQIQKAEAGAQKLQAPQRII